MKEIIQNDDILGKEEENGETSETKDFTVNKKRKNETNDGNKKNKKNKKNEIFERTGNANDLNAEESDDLENGESTKSDEMINEKKGSKKCKKYIDKNKNTEEKVEESESSSSAENSSSSDEDHDGLLLTSKFKKKFSNLLLKLKSKDSNLLNKKDDCFFHDSDFDTDTSKDDVPKESDEEENKKNGNNENEKKNSINYSEFYKDILLKEGSQAFDNEEENLLNKEKEAYSSKNRKSYFDEQDELKKKILEACKIADEEYAKNNDENEGDFFTIKEKTENEILEEKKYFENFLSTSNHIKESDNLLKEYWKDDLNKDEEFLRDYILKELWREDKIHNIYEEIDEIDDEELEKSERFEKTYNFRFEEQNGNIINSAPRKIDNSVRQENEKKKKKRDRKKEKRIKKRELKRKMLLEELKNKENNKDANTALLNKSSNNNEVNNKNDNSKNLEHKANNKNTQEHSDNDLWYLCDECQYAIMPLSYVFECNTCDNFTLCKKCFKMGKHEHPLKKMLVPIYCEPPANYEDDNNNEHDPNNINGKTKKRKKNQSNEIEYLENDSSGYEDLIDDMPIRYKYIKVKPRAFNLTTDFILKTDDTKLDEIVPMKKISPYYQNTKKSSDRKPKKK
ncbi:protein KRI1, putative [Plasmodium vinckei lentum]|uniref:Protein KRI1, putative n=1 Tax=Plasmodium vinckei lentum TaxID=138297 RepID=A0A6V7S243_PLAVN|nr:protein KRI1, putative [Plasmodium vinckei lentum]